MVSDGGIETTPEQGRTIPGFVWILMAAVLVTGAGYYFLSGSNEGGTMSTTFVVRQGDLDIVVLEGGMVEARESQQIRSEVKGSAKILNIVEEGYQVTAEDVANGMILVELDTAQLNDELISDQISYESAEEQQIATAADYEITINQNESTIKAAELLVKFARMDFQKFLGAEPVAEILKDLGLDEETLRIKAENEAAVKVPVTTLKNLVGSTLGSMSPEIRDDIVNRLGGANGGKSATGAAGASPKFEDLIIDDELNQAIRAAFMAKMSEGGAGGQWGGGRGGGGDGQPGAGRPGRGGGNSAGRGPGGRGGAEGRRGGGGGGRQLTPERIERMREMGVDVYDIARKAGKLKTPGATAEVPGIVVDGSVVDVALVHQRPRDDVDFSKYTDVGSLEDGEALQRLRTLKAAVLSAKAMNLVAQSELVGSEKLFAREFITPMDLEKQRIQVQNSKTSEEAAETAQELYIKYEFPKMAEQLLSNYEESLMALERAQKLAGSRLSQSAAKMSSSKRKFLYEAHDLKDTQQMIANSIIPAKRTGLVVYGSSSGSGGRDSHRGGSREPIMEGTSVRERQLILTIPDMTKMGVAVKVQESSIQKVKVGQKARITIESRPDEILEGEVVKVAVLPDAADRWMNPDMTVYNVSVRIDSINEWLQPGGTSQVEILVNKLVDVVYVPIQAISASGKNRYVHVSTGGSVERRLVETGGFTDLFIEIKSGLSKGDVVQLRIPDALEESSPGEDGSTGSGLFASV